jgi:hypothetical protein
MERAAIQKELLDLRNVLTQRTWPHDQTIGVLIIASSDILLLIEYISNEAPNLPGKRTALALVNQALQQLDIIYTHLTHNTQHTQDILTQINQKLLHAIDALLIAD